MLWMVITGLIHTTSMLLAMPGKLPKPTAIGTRTIISIFQTTDRVRILSMQWISGLLVIVTEMRNKSLKEIQNSRTGKIAFNCLLVLVMLVCAAGHSFASDRPVRIMPIGSSSTHAQFVTYTYRYFLYHMLTGGGVGFDFVGSHDTLYCSPTPLDSLPDPEHEGHWHWGTEAFFPYIGTWARATQPDIALIHLGFVDLLADRYDADNTAAEIGQLIDSLRSVNPVIVVLLAQIIPMPSPYDPSTLNTRIASLASAKTTVNSPVILIDQNSDMVHPDDYAPCGSVTDSSGAHKMAGRWYNGLVPVLNETTPRIAVTSPVDGGIVSPGVNIPVTTVVFSQNTINKVAFYLDGSKLGEDSEAPYEWLITGLSAGNYAITAKAIDINLNEGISESVTIEVGNLPPEVTILSPLDRSWYTAPADITLTAEAIDSDGSIAYIELYEGSTLLDQVSTEPYSHSLTGLTPGTYTYAARAIDNEGRSAVSDSVLVRVLEQGLYPFLETDGTCIMEAENCSYLNARNDDTQWAQWADPACGNGAYMLAGNSSLGSGTQDFGCEMVFEVYITTPGYYFLAARRKAPTSSHDSALLGIDGKPYGSRIIEWVSTDWAWCQSYSIGYLSAGIHSVHIRRREDGLGIDKIMIARTVSDLPQNGSVEIGGVQSPYMTGQDPVAHAGDDRTVDLNTPVTLDGSLSVDPQPLSYSWSQISGPAVSLTGAHTAQPAFTADRHGRYVFQLEVNDGNAADTDTVAVNVRVSVVEGTESADFLVPTLNTSYYILWADSSQNATYLSTGNGGTVNRSFNTLKLDNGYVEVVVSPDLGMRILRALDKSTALGRQMFAEYSDPVNPVPFAQNFGGVKPSFPYVENSTGMIDLNGELNYKAGYYIENNDDGSVDIVMNMRFEEHQNQEDAGFLGKYGDKNLTSIVTLEPGHADFKVRYIAENPNPLRRNDRIWNNACYPDVYGAGGQWLFPTKWALSHFAEEIWDIENDGPLDNPQEALEQYGSYFALNPQYPFAGTWYPSPDANHLRIADPVKYPGCKIYNHANNSDPYELWGSTNNVFEVPEDFVETFETNDLEYRYYMARGIGLCEYANDHIAIGVSGGTFSLTAPYDNSITVYEYNESSSPILENSLVGPGIVLTGSFTHGLRITAGGEELCNVQLPLVYEDNSADWAALRESAQRSDLAHHLPLDASHGLNYELEDVAAKTRVLSSLASLLAVENITSADDPDILVSMANAAYRHGGFDVVARYCDSIGDRRPQQTAYLQALMDLETTGSGDFSNTPIEGNYFKALQYIKDGTPSLALAELDELLAQRPNALRPRLMRAWLNNDIDDALIAVENNPGSIEAWTVLNELGYAGAADKLTGLLDQNIHATYRMNDFLDELQNGNWRHERRFEYEHTWWEEIDHIMPLFPDNLKYVPSGVNQPPTVVLTSPENYSTSSSGSDINITATADDIDGTVTVVEFYEGSTLLWTDNTAPYSFTWTGPLSGSYTLTAEAVDNLGASTVSDPVYITVGEVLAGLFLEQHGTCVMEAEHAHRVDQRYDVTNWIEATAVADYMGDGYMEVPDGTGGGDDTWDANCELAWDVHISTPGTYHIAVRYRAPDGGSNSAKHGVDGIMACAGDFWQIVSSWNWFHGTNPLGYLDAGTHTVQIRRREDGWQVDRVMIALNTADFPAHLSTDTGPAESERSQSLSDITVNGISQNGRAFLYGTSAWQGDKMLDGSGVITDVNPGNHLLVLRDPGKRTEYIPLLLERQDTTVTVTMHDAVRITFGEKDTLTSNGSIIDLNEYASVVRDDIDRDGDVDLLAGVTSGLIHFYENNGNDLIFSSDIDLGTSDLQCIRIADWNDDNKPDILAGVSNGDVTIYYNQGSMTFGSGQILVNCGDDLTGFDCFDNDNDDDPDFICGYATGEIKMIGNNGNGFDTPVAVQTFDGLAIQAGDSAAPLIVELSGDEYSDLCITSASDTLVWYEQTSAGTYMYRGVVMSAGMPIRAAGKGTLAGSYNASGQFISLLVADTNGIVVKTDGVLCGDFVSDGSQCVDVNDLNAFGDAWGSDEDDAGWVWELNLDLVPGSSGIQCIDVADLHIFGDCYGNEK
ncbi:MAG: DUF5107 domain-containing protein [Chitinivibrionales bacterium]|nr:DUF5107 domain-containing protein [Chitinivibrionales bacterium]